MRLAARPNAARRGLSLLEVLVATAIFLFSMVALGRLIILSGDISVEVQQQAEAAHMAQAKLAEVVAGVVPLSSQSDVPFDEDPDWQWSLDAQSDPTVTGIWRVQVKVSRTHPTGRKIESTLSQIVLDPSIRGSNADVTASINTPLATSSSSSQSGSSGSSSQTPSTTTPAATSTPASAPKATTPTPSTPTTSSKGGKS
jgi:general secretion pathway protein I